MALLKGKLNFYILCKKLYCPSLLIYCNLKLTKSAEWPQNGTLPKLSEGRAGTAWQPSDPKIYHIAVTYFSLPFHFLLSLSLSLMLHRVNKIRLTYRNVWLTKKRRNLKSCFIKCNKVRNNSVAYNEWFVLKLCYARKNLVYASCSLTQVKTTIQFRPDSIQRFWYGTFDCPLDSGFQFSTLVTSLNKCSPWYTGARSGDLGGQGIGSSPNPTRPT